MHLLKRDKEKSRERLRFPAGRWSTRATDPQGWHYWPSNRAGCWGLITERERHINVSLHSSSTISQLRDGKFWCLLRSLELFVLFCLDLLESQAYNPMTTLAKTTRLDSTHSNKNKPSHINYCPFIYVTVLPASPLEWQASCHHAPTYTCFSLSIYYTIRDF